MKFLFLFFSKILYTPIIPNYLNFHHIALFQKTPFNKTEYNDVYGVDFCPCGSLVEVISGKKLQGKVRLFHIDKCDANDIYKIILLQEISEYRNVEILNKIKRIDKNLYDRIQSWEPVFQLYGRNCQDFVKYILFL